MTKRKSTQAIENNIQEKCSRIDEVLARGNNALMMVNEIGIKGLKWEVEQIIDVFPQKFRASCEFTETFAGKSNVVPSGFTFFAEGSSKGICKHEVAKQIMLVLTGSSDISSNANDKTTNDSEPVTQNNQDAQSITSKTNQSSNGVSIEDAVRILNERIKDLKYSFELTEFGYCCFVSIRTILYKGVGTSKKIAKRALAVQILKELFNVTIIDEKPQKPSPEIEMMEVEKLPQNRQKNFSNIIQSMVTCGFEIMTNDLEVQYSKRKVLAGIVMSRKLKCVFPQYYKEFSNSANPITMDPLQFFTTTRWNLNPCDSGEILKLITVTSGTKCLSGNDINSHGKVLNDCHAEVISKRALQLFIFKTIKRYQNQENFSIGDDLYGCDILSHFDDNNPWVYRIKDDVNFHLYISSPPCGDSRIFQPQNNLNNIIMDESDNEQDEDSHPFRKNRGLLRTKIECGEGTIPIKVKHTQTWDGILGGERLLTMSCSDKVCLWNVVGLQGALLSNMLTKPIYLNSITIGSMFHQEHLQRALYERIKSVTAESYWKGISNDEPVDIDEGELIINLSEDNSVDKFFVNSAFILNVSDQNERNPSKSTMYSFNWLLGEDSVEICHTSKGVTCENFQSRLCKRNLFKMFLFVFNWLQYIDVPTNGIENNFSKLYRYCDFKNLKTAPDHALGSVEYQRKKVCLYKYFESHDQGKWISKPIEQDWFEIKKPDSMTQPQPFDKTCTNNEEVTVIEIDSD